MCSSNKPEQAIELHSNPNKKKNNRRKILKTGNLTENPDSRAKPNPRRNFYGKNIASRNSPDHVESKYIHFKKPDSAPKIQILVSGKYLGYKKPKFLILLDEH